jgi:hypothetical protein
MTFDNGGWGTEAPTERNREATIREDETRGILGRSSGLRSEKVKPSSIALSVRNAFMFVVCLSQQLTRLGVR